jgi:hypothetical protein
MTALKTAWISSVSCHLKEQSHEYTKVKHDLGIPVLNGYSFAAHDGAEDGMDLICKFPN